MIVWYVALMYSIFLLFIDFILIYLFIFIYLFIYLFILFSWKYQVTTVDNLFVLHSNNEKN